MKRYLEIFVKAHFATYLLDIQAHVVVFHIRFLLIKSRKKKASANRLRMICRGFALQDFAF